MRPSTIQIYGSKPMIYDISCLVVNSKYTIYDVSYIRLYATCRCFSHRNGRVAGLYKFSLRFSLKHLYPLMDTFIQRHFNGQITVYKYFISFNYK